MLLRVIEERCAECVFDYAATARRELPGAVATWGALHAAILAGIDAVTLRTHHRLDVWSALEYGCHTRDVLAVQGERIYQVLTVQEPLFESMRREQRAVEFDYNAQDPHVVATQLTEAAGYLRQLLLSLAAEDWHRTGWFNWPVPTQRDVDWMARHALHELVHHLLDVRRQINGPQAPTW